MNTPASRTTYYRDPGFYLGFILGVALLFYLFAYPYISVTRKLDAICDGLKPGSSFNEIKNTAESEGLSAFMPAGSNNGGVMIYKDVPGLRLFRYVSMEGGKANGRRLQ